MSERYEHDGRRFTITNEFFNVATLNAAAINVDEYDATTYGLINDVANDVIAYDATANDVTIGSADAVEDARSSIK